MMKLIIENDEDTTITDVRHVSITDTRHIAVVWWELMSGKKSKLKRFEPKPRRIILELGEDVFPASVNYGQVRG